MTDNQKNFRDLYFRFHVSQDLTIGDLQEVIKFKLNCKIDNPSQKIVVKDKVVLFNENISLLEGTGLRDLYI